MPICLPNVYGYFCATSAELTELHKRIYGPWGWQYLPSGPLEAKFANPAPDHPFTDITQVMSPTLESHKVITEGNKPIPASFGIHAW